MKTFFVLILLLALLAGLSSFWLTRPIFKGELDAAVYRSVTIAPRDEALTLARNLAGDVLLVTAADAEGVAVINVSLVADRKFEDVLQAHEQLGDAGLQKLYSSSPQINLSWRDLGMPIARRYPHIAAGTNYRAHAEEVGHEGEPFLFPKLSRPSTWQSDVSMATRLDYEVELCAVTLTEHTSALPSRLGLLLCGDYTDRWLLVKDIDLDGIMGRTGFPAAKGGQSHLPIGPLLVIPGSVDFYRRIELSLYVNDQLRQKSGAEQMIWSAPQIVSRALADCHSPYQLGSQTIRIADCARIPAGTLLLTGTPEGVLFHLATLWNPWAYLREGDVVTGFGTYLGFTRNEVISKQAF